MTDEPPPGVWGVYACDKEGSWFHAMTLTVWPPEGEERDALRLTVGTYPEVVVSWTTASGTREEMARYRGHAEGI